MNQQVVLKHGWQARALLFPIRKTAPVATPVDAVPPIGQEMPPETLVDLDALRRVLAQMKSVPGD